MIKKWFERLIINIIGNNLYHFNTLAEDAVINRILSKIDEGIFDKSIARRISKYDWQLAEKLATLSTFHGDILRLNYEVTNNLPTIIRYLKNDVENRLDKLEKKSINIDDVNIGYINPKKEYKDIK